MMNVSGSAAQAFAASPLVSRSQRAESKSDTPDATSSHETATGSLAALVAGLVPAGREEALASALIACLNGSTLQLTRLDPSLRPLAFALPPAAWTLLDGLAGQGIAWVEVPQPARSEDIPVLARGLAVLPWLCVLELPVPRSGQAVDLSALHATGRPQDLRLGYLRAEAWQVTVPAGCQVQASGPALRTHHLFKPVVTYVDTCGQPTGERHALAGIPYRAKPAASIVRAAEGDLQSARLRALALNTNGKARFEADATVPADDLYHRTIWCRHMAWQVGRDWQARRGLQQVGMPVSMSYEPYASPEALRAHVSRESDAQYDQLRRRGASDLFTANAFGEALQAHFDTLPPGGERVFMLTTCLHAMTMELRRKGRHGILTFYDPNISTLPLKLLVTQPSELRRLSLRDLLAGSYRDYVPAVALVAGSLFDLEPEGKHPRAPARLHGFDDSLLASSEGLHWLLAYGASGDIERAVQRIVAASGDSPYLVLAKACAYLESRSGLVQAISWQLNAAADALVDALLRHALPVLGIDLTARALMPLTLMGPAQVSDRTAIHVALDENPAFIGSYARRVLAEPSLDAEGRNRLLTLPQGRTILREAMSLPATGPASELSAHRLEALDGLLRALLGAPGLDPQRRRAALAEQAGHVPWTRPFHDRLAAGDPLPAAVLLCACLDPALAGTVPPGSLGLDVDAVLEALHADRQHPVARTWAQRLCDARNAQDRAGEQAACHVDARGDAHRPLTLASTLDYPPAAAAHARTLLAVPPASAGPRHLERFLQARGLNGRPLLHALVDQAGRSLAAQRALYLLVREIATAPHWDMGKPELLGALDLGEGGHLTAAGHALQLDPITALPAHRDAAAAMVCAILESGRPAADQALWLNALRINLADVLGPTPEEVDPPTAAGDWSLRILRALEGSGLPASLTGPAFLRAGELGLGGKLPAGGRAWS